MKMIDRDPLTYMEELDRKMNLQKMILIKKDGKESKKLGAICEDEERDN